MATATIEQKRRAAASASGKKTAKSDSPYRFGRPNETVDPAQPPTFRFFVVQTAGGTMKLLTNITEVTWDDSYAILTGQMTTVEPDDSLAKFDPYIDVREGNLIVCQVNEGHGFKELWRMRVKKPAFAVQSRTWTYDLQNDLALLDMSRDSFHYKKDKNHPKGWLGHEIVADVCARFRVPLGQMYVGTRYISRIGYGRRGVDWSNVSPLDVIRWVVWFEARHGRRLVLRYSGGKLHLIPFKRSPRLFALGPQLLDAAFTAELPPWFVTAIEMRGLWDYVAGQDDRSVPKAKRQKMHVLVRSVAAIKKYGFVKVFKYSPDAKTDADLKEEGQLYLAYAARPRFAASLSCPGIPLIQRGDSIVLGVGSDAARKQLVWVTSAQHEFQPGSYTTTVNVTFDDPYVVPTGKKLLERLRDTHDQAAGTRQLTSPFASLNPKADKNRRDEFTVVPTDPGPVGG